MVTSTLTHGRVIWTNITAVNEQDVRLLRAQHPNSPTLDLEDLLSRNERPKIDEYDDYLFVVMQFPVWDAASRAAEVDLFIGEGFLVTVHEGVLKPLNALFAQCQNDPDLRQKLMGRGASRLFYTVIDSLVDYILPTLYKVDANIRAVEEILFTDNLRQVIEDIITLLRRDIIALLRRDIIALLRRDIIALRRIIRPQTAIVANLEKVDRAFIHEKLDVYFGDIVDHLQKASDLLADHDEVISVLADSADTLASHRINEVIRILTVISVIMLPLTLISSVYGMNVELPHDENPYALIEIILLMGVIMVAMLTFFKRKKWL